MPVERLALATAPLPAARVWKPNRHGTARRPTFSDGQESEIRINRAQPLQALRETPSMFIPFGADVRSKVAILAILFTISAMALGQDNFMMGFYSSSMGDTVINRGDFNNDGILDVITGNNGGTGGNGVSVNLGTGDGRCGEGVGCRRQRLFGNAKHHSAVTS